MKRGILWGLVAVAAIAVGIGGFFYYRHEQRFPSTNDAYIKADVVNVAAQVAGRVSVVPVGDQVPVEQGQLLFRIDPQSYQDRVKSARAKLAQARQTVASRQAAVNASKASVSSRQSQLDNAREHFHRTKSLVDRGARAHASLDDARARLRTARAELQLAESKLHQARIELGDAGERNSRVRQAQAALDQAKLDLRHTRVVASCDGRLSNLQLYAGDMIGAGEPQFALVCTRRFWVYANFKETALTRLRPGQVATVTIDTYPDQNFHGIVQSLNPASGTAFSMLPPENATGNWVKVAQRVPVRILIVDGRPDYPLRVQTSAEVSVQTGAESKPAGRSRGANLSDLAAMQLAAQKGLIEAPEAVVRN